MAIEQTPEHIKTLNGFLIEANSSHQVFEFPPRQWVLCTPDFYMYHKLSLNLPNVREISDSPPQDPNSTIYLLIGRLDAPLADLTDRTNHDHFGLRGYTPEPPALSEMLCFFTDGRLSLHSRADLVLRSETGLEIPVKPSHDYGLRSDRLEDMHVSDRNEVAHVAYEIIEKIRESKT